MKRYLMRHAAAEPAGEGGDRHRPLTSEGRRQAEEAGRALCERGDSLRRVLTSPYLRARETARLVAGQFAPPLPIEVREGISAGAAPSQFADAADEAVDLLVGHMPDLAIFVQQATGESLSFRPATICCLEIDGAAKIVWVRHPEG